MTDLTIYRRYFYNAKCYNEAPLQTVKGVQVHSTGANNPWLKRYVQPDDGRLGVNANGNSHNNPSSTVCASAYIGKQASGEVAVYQVLPWNQRCWLSGKGSKGNANKLGYVGFEICEDGKLNEDYFRKAMDAAMILTAYLCQAFGLDPDLAVKDHNELHDAGLASNHGDITHWLQLYDMNMDDFRAGVKERMAEEISVTYIDCDEVTTMYQARVTCPGSYLNLRRGKSTSYSSLAPIPQGATVDVIDDTDAAWWRIQYNGLIGWSMAMYLTRIEDKAEQPAEEVPSDAETVRPDCVQIERLKLTEIKACLVDILGIIENALK